MNKHISREWNKRVKRGDIVFHLGDLASPRDKDPKRFIEHLNGTIILVKGNHDKPELVKKMPMWTRSMGRQIGQYHCLLNHRPLYPNSMLNTHNDPFGDHDNSIDNPNQYDFILSGHIHNNYEEKNGKKIGRLWTGRSLNLSVELHNYAPVSEEEVLAMLNARNNSIHQGTYQDIILGDKASWLKMN